MPLPAFLSDLFAGLARAEHHLEAVLGIRHEDISDTGSGPAATVAAPESAPAATTPAGSLDDAARDALAATGVKPIGPLKLDPQRVREAAASFRAVDPSATNATIRLWLAQTSIESSFGRGWGWSGAGYGNSSTDSGPGAKCWNMGAEQCPGGQPGTGYTCIDHQDSHADGTKFFAKYKCFPSQVDAARGYLGLLGAPRYAAAMSGARAGDPAAFVKGLFTGGWFEGIGKTPEERWGKYLAAVLARLPAIDAAIAADQGAASAPADPPLAGVGASSGGFDAVTWVEVDAGGGYLVKTNAEPLARNGVPVAMSFSDVIAACVALRAVPVTAQIEDARWRAAAVSTVVPPVPSTVGALDVRTAKGKDQAATFAASYGPLGTVLRAGGSKAMLAENDRRKVKTDAAAMLQPSGAGSMSFYGWKKLGGGMFQQGIKSDHNREWIEYDSFAYVALRDATKDGQPVDLLAELARGCALGGPLAPWLVAALSAGAAPVADPHPLASLVPSPVPGDAGFDAIEGGGAGLGTGRG